MADYIKTVKGGVVGGNSINLGFSLVEAYVTRGGETELWGQTWTAEDINNSGFGCVIRVEGGSNQSHYLKATNFGYSIPSGATIDGIKIEVEGLTQGGANRTVYVDHIRITVYYTAGTDYTETFSETMSTQEIQIKSFDKIVLSNLSEQESSNKNIDMIKQDNTNYSDVLIKDILKQITENINYIDDFIFKFGILVSINEILRIEDNTVRQVDFIKSILDNLKEIDLSSKDIKINKIDLINYIDILSFVLEKIINISEKLKLTEVINTFIPTILHILFYLKNINKSPTLNLTSNDFVIKNLNKETIIMTSAKSIIIKNLNDNITIKEEV